MPANQTKSRAPRGPAQSGASADTKSATQASGKPRTKTSKAAMPNGKKESPGQPPNSDKAKEPKLVKRSVQMSESEHDELKALKDRLSEELGKKIKRAELVRASIRLLLRQPLAGVKRELAKLDE